VRQHLDTEILLFFNYKLLRSFNQHIVQETIYIHKNCYLISSRYEKEEKKNY
jgi:hypothetical protein